MLEIAGGILLAGVIAFVLVLAFTNMRLIGSIACVIFLLAILLGGLA